MVQLLNRLNFFLMNRTQKLIVNRYNCSSSEVISGVSQGTVLGPLLLCPAADYVSITTDTQKV